MGATPRIFPLGLSSGKAIELATFVVPLGRALMAAFSPCVRFNLGEPLRDPNGMELRRRMVLKRIANHIFRRHPLRARLAKDLPKDSPSSNIHLPLIRLLARSMGRAQLSLSTDLMAGMNTSGRIPAANALDTRTTPATTDFARTAKAPRPIDGRIIRFVASVEEDTPKSKF